MGNTGLALGGKEAGSSPEVWNHVGAVLNVGSWEDTQYAPDRLHIVPKVVFSRL